jgi:hypothetical protein
MRRLAQLFVFLSMMTTSAYAQETGSVGLTMGYPPAFGVILHVADRVAVRPELSWSHNSSEVISTITITLQGISNTTSSRSTSDSWTVGVGASGLFYISKSDGLSTYVSPRLMYTRGASSTTSSTPSPITPNPSEFTTSGYLASGSFGAQYALGRRFGVFGEVGLAYSRTKASNNLTVAGRTTTHTVNTRTGAGVLWYF